MSAIDPNAWMAGGGGAASTAIGAGKRAARGTAADAGHVSGVEYDRYGRYLLPDPATGEERGWTRVTTLLGCLGSDHGLDTWTERGIIEGLALRPDLRSLLASAPGDKKVADEVLAAAKEASGQHAARRHGSAVHGALERSLLGQPLVLDADEPVARDLAAIMLLLEGEGLRVVRVERVVLHATLGYAGRLDLVVEVTLPDGRTVHRVTDVKTGKDAGRGARARKTAAQLAAYARSTHIRLDDGSLVDTQREISLDLDAGYVIAVRDGAAELLEADLTSGWTDVLLAAKEHQRRKAASDMLPVGRRYLAPESQIVADLRAAVTEAAEAAPLAAVAPSLPAPTGGDVPPVGAVEEKTATGRAKPKCSKCRQPGHRAKTCTVRVEAGPPILDEPIVTVDERAVAARPGSIADLLTEQVTCDCSTPQWSVPEWSARPDVTVCASCGWPSSATLTRLLGERSGLASVTTDDVTPSTLAVLQAGGGQGWDKARAVANLAHAADDVTAQIKAAVSRAELSTVWQTAMAAGTWTEAHSALATERAPGLPPTSDLPF